MASPLTTQDLKDLKCPNPDCPDTEHPITLHSECHPGLGSEVSYDKGRGVLIVACDVCEQVFAEFYVAEYKGRLC